MRAGLLSDPRVVALLRAHVIPCHVSALNTPECMTDPRDVETLGRYADVRERFQGGEREAFLLPDGLMMKVFLSLHGTSHGSVQMTAAGRRSEEAVIPFRTHAERAFRAIGNGLPADWNAIWDGTSGLVKAVERQAPRWPRPEAGTAALRVFVRNSYRMYDDLHGCELVVLPAGLETEWSARLKGPGDSVVLPEALFFDLARAMVPRGQVGTRLADASISGGLRLRATEIAGDEVRGAVEGEYALEPRDRSEVGLRDSAVCMFSSRGRVWGEFALDRAAGSVRELRFVAADVEFEWMPRHHHRAEYFEPWHRVAVEWVRSDEE